MSSWAATWVGLLWSRDNCWLGRSRKEWGEALCLWRAVHLRTTRSKKKKAKSRMVSTGFSFWWHRVAVENIHGVAAWTCVNSCDLRRYLGKALAIDKIIELSAILVYSPRLSPLTLRPFLRGELGREATVELTIISVCWQACYVHSSFQVCCAFC